MTRPTIRVSKTDEQIKKEQLQAKLIEIETSKAKGSLTHEEKQDIIIKQNDIIIELLQILQPLK